MQKFIKPFVFFLLGVGVTVGLADIGIQMTSNQGMFNDIYQRIFFFPWLVAILMGYACFQFFELMKNTDGNWKYIAWALFYKTFFVGIAFTVHITPWLLFPNTDALHTYTRLFESILLDFSGVLAIFIAVFMFYTDGASLEPREEQVLQILLIAVIIIYAISLLGTFGIIPIISESSDIKGMIIFGSIETENSWCIWSLHPVSMENIRYFPLQVTCK
jgi:hypothetical protein